jgi:hypothetical protein
MCIYGSSYSYTCVCGQLQAQFLLANLEKSSTIEMAIFHMLHMLLNKHLK